MIIYIDPGMVLIYTGVALLIIAAAIRARGEK
jgi:hypothetical protein